MTGTRIAKAVIRAADFVLDLVIILAVFILASFGAYSIWDTQQIYSSVSAARYETYKPKGAEDTMSFSELRSINPDVIGWITIYGTGIDYPLVQGDNNDEYMNKTATGEFALGGSIFLSAGNAADFSDFNSIIYGHHMEQSQMFGDIDKFEDESYFRNHRYGNLYYNGTDHGIEFFAMVNADAYDFDLYAEKVQGKESYLSYVKQIARYWRDESLPMAADHIVMLSTCSDANTNGRYVLFGKITNKTYEDTSVSEETIVSRTLSAVSTDNSGISTVYIVGIGLIIILAGVIILTVRRR